MNIVFPRFAGPIVATVFVGVSAITISSNALRKQSSPMHSSSLWAACDSNIMAKNDISLSYTQLEGKLKEIEKLSGIKSLLGWDEMVLLQAGSSAARNAHKEALSSIIFEKQTSKDLESLILKFSKVSDEELSNLTSFERANIRDAIREFGLIIKKTKDMTSREAVLEGEGYQAWAVARKDNNFAHYAPFLSDIISLKKEIATVTHPSLSFYDGNIDQFERGMKTERLLAIFNAVKSDLVPVIKRIDESNTRKEYVVPEALKGGPAWDVEKQKLLCTEIAEAIGFDFTRGRFDVSVHPFTGGPHPTDVRITTRYSSDNWLEGIGGTVHEVGHALYEQGRNAKYDNTPVSRALSMGVHESQSLFWERMIFQSREFWIWATPIVHKYFPHTLSCSAEDFYKYVNQVEPGLIRIEADEVTYPMHIILRFEIEQGFFDGSVNVADLPTVWNAKMKQLLNVDVPSDAKGCLQDIHWSMGALGYFPSYTLGAMIAAQLLEKVEKEIPDVREKIKRGEFHVLRDWLRVNIHEVGSLYASPDELLRVVTGKPLDPAVYVNYIKNKYGDLYKL